MNTANGSEIANYVRSLSLIDNHCHSVKLSKLTQLEFGNLLRESPPRKGGEEEAFHSMIGMSVLKSCPAVLGTTGFVEPSEYIELRESLAPLEVATRFMSSLDVSVHLVDTGFNAGDLASLEEFSHLSKSVVYEVVRLEAIAEETLLNYGAETFLEVFPDILRSRVSKAAGVKCIAAYRGGLDLTANMPDSRQVYQELKRLVTDAKSSKVRVYGTLIESYLAHLALEVLTLPIQFHVGFGDPDVQIDRANPSHLTPFIRRAAELGREVILLHCYPYHREAAYLTHAFENVYLDLGLTMNYVGSRSVDVLMETLELAPFERVMYSSDAYGLAELHFLGQLVFRDALTQVLYAWITGSMCSLKYAKGVADLVGSRNAQRLYRL